MSSLRSVLYVEGKNDEKAIAALLHRHGIDTEPKTRQFDIKAAKADDDDQTESIDVLLAAIPEAVRRSSNTPVGFVLDADSNIQSRWDAVRFRLEDLGIECPRNPVSRGFIADVPNYNTRVGVWLMPNNTDTGMLEHFLQGLITAGDKLLPLAQETTTTAMSTERRFPEIHEPKAVIHTWLAWQEKPGIPFGTEITAEYFSHDTEIALAFVSWFRQLYGV